MRATDVALRLGLNPRTLLDFIHAGVITPARDRHGRWVYTEAHIEAIRAHMATRKVRRAPDWILEPRILSRARGC